MTRSRFTTFAAGAVLAGLSALPVGALAAANGGAPGADQPATAASAKKTVEQRTTSLGKVLVDAEGRTLYLFKKDTPGRSACSGGCASFWPPLRVSGKPTAGSGISASKLGTIRRSDGRPQVTYDGHPLYTFVQDTKAGQTHGEGVTAFGAKWFVLSPAGSQIAHG